MECSECSRMEKEEGLALHTQSAINLMLICIVAFVGLSAREVVGLCSPAMMIRIIKYIERPDNGLLAAYDAARSH